MSNDELKLLKDEFNKILPKNISYLLLIGDEENSEIKVACNMPFETAIEVAKAFVKGKEEVKSNRWY